MIISGTTDKQDDQYGSHPHARNARGDEKKVRESFPGTVIPSTQIVAKCTRATKRVHVHVDGRRASSESRSGTSFLLALRVCVLSDFASWVVTSLVPGTEPIVAFERSTRGR